MLRIETTSVFALGSGTRGPTQGGRCLALAHLLYPIKHTYEAT